MHVKLWMCVWLATATLALCSATLVGDEVPSDEEALNSIYSLVTGTFDVADLDYIAGQIAPLPAADSSTLLAYLAMGPVTLKVPIESTPPGQNVADSKQETKTVSRNQAFLIYARCLDAKMKLTGVALTKDEAAYVDRAKTMMQVWETRDLGANRFVNKNLKYVWVRRLSSWGLSQKVSFAVAQKALAEYQENALRKKQDIKETEFFKIRRIYGDTYMNHPVFGSFMRLFRALVIAKELDDDDDAARQYAQSCRNLLDAVHSVLRDSDLYVNDRGSGARWFWNSERMTYGMAIGNVESAVSKVLLGAYHMGQVDYTATNLEIVGKLCVKLMGPAALPQAELLPGSTISRKIPMGCAITPLAILTFYLKIDVSFPGVKNANSAFGFDASGFTGATAVKTVDVQEKTTGTTLAGSVAYSNRGIDPSLKISNPSVPSSPSISVDKKGEVKLSASFKPDPDGPSVSVDSTMNKLSMSVLAPEVKFLGASVKMGVVVEVESLDQFWEKTIVATANLAFIRHIVMAYVAVAALPVAVTAAELVAVGAPVVIHAVTAELAATGATTAALQLATN